MFGISGTELVLVALFALIIFGPDKIPEIARTVSKAVAMFKRVQEDTERLIKAEMFSLDSDDADRSEGAPAMTPAEAVSPTSVATTLYASNDDEDEEEEEE